MLHVSKHKNMLTVSMMTTAHKEKDVTYNEYNRGSAAPEKISGSQKSIRPKLTKCLYI